MGLTRHYHLNQQWPQRREDLFKVSWLEASQVELVRRGITQAPWEQRASWGVPHL